MESQASDAVPDITQGDSLKERSFELCSTSSTTFHLTAKKTDALPLLWSILKFWVSNVQGYSFAIFPSVSRGI